LLLRGAALGELAAFGGVGLGGFPPAQCACRSERNSAVNVFTVPAPLTSG
jgi:hypothetical protein